MVSLPTEVPHRGAVAAILLLEDEPVLRSSIARGLARMAGVEVLAAANFAEALELLSARVPQVVVSDIDLPDRSGLEMVGELARRGIRAPIIFVTAYLKTYRSRIPQRDDIVVLEKPVPLEHLRARVAECVGLGGDRARVPFSVADYVQLACLGHHSLLVEVEQPGLAAARVVVHRGELWSACDATGSGEAAFRRLAFVVDEVVRCTALVGEPGRRDIQARFDALVLDAARQHDEAELATAEASGEGALPSLLEEEDLVEDEPPSSSSAPLPSPPRPPTPPAPAALPPSELRAFEELWDDGVDALLRRDYAAAERAFRGASGIQPGDPRVNANLARLRQLGYSGASADGGAADGAQPPAAGTLPDAARPQRAAGAADDGAPGGGRT